MDIDKPIAIVLFALSLYGCAPDARTLIEYAPRTGPDALNDLPGAPAVRAPIECARIETAACGSLALRLDCTTVIGAGRLPCCTPLQGFTPNEHGTRGVAGLQDFAYCASDPAQVAAAARGAGWRFTAR